MSNATTPAPLTGSLSALTTVTTRPAVGASSSVDASALSVKGRGEIADRGFGRLPGAVDGIPSVEGAVLPPLGRVVATSPFLASRFRKSQPARAHATRTATPISRIFMFDPTSYIARPVCVHGAAGPRRPRTLAGVVVSGPPLPDRRLLRGVRALRALDRPSPPRSQFAVVGLGSPSATPRVDLGPSAHPLSNSLALSGGFFG